jgi:hypothetical protein
MDNIELTQETVTEITHNEQEPIRIAEPEPEYRIGEHGELRRVFAKPEHPKKNSPNSRKSKIGEKPRRHHKAKK